MMMVLITFETASTLPQQKWRRDVGSGEGREGDASSQTTRLVEMLDPSYHPFCLASSLQH